MASMEEDLFFSLVRKSRPQLNESSLSGGVIFKLGVRERWGELMEDE